MYRYGYSIVRKADVACTLDCLRGQRGRREEVRAAGVHYYDDDDYYYYY